MTRHSAVVVLLFGIYQCMVPSHAHGQEPLRCEAPSAGSWIIGGDTVRVAWSGGADIDSVDIMISTNGGSMWRLVRSVKNTGSFAFIAPSTVSERVRIAVQPYDPLRGGLTLARTFPFRSKAAVGAFALTPNDSLLLIGGKGVGTMLYDVASGQFLRDQWGSDVVAISMFPGNRFTLIAQKDAVLWQQDMWLWDFRDFSQSYPNKSLAVTPDGKQTFGQSESNIRIHRFNYGRARELLLDTVSRPFRRVAVDPRTAAIAVGLKRGDVIIVDTATAETIDSLVFRDVARDGNYIPGEVRSLEYTADGSKLIVLVNRFLTIWDMNQTPPTKREIQLPNNGHTATISRDGRFLAATTRDSVLYLWDLTTMQAVDSVRRQVMPVQMHFNSTSTRLYTAGGDAVYEWEVGESTIMEGATTGDFTIGWRYMPAWFEVSSVDFGPVDVNLTKDTVPRILVTSRSGRSDIGWLKIVGRDSTRFFVDPLGPSDTITDARSWSRRIRFIPRVAGPAEAQLVIHVVGWDTNFVVPLSGIGTGVLGVEDEGSSTVPAVDVHPNPASDWVEIELRGPDVSEVRVVDLLGQIVGAIDASSESLTGRSLRIDTSLLPDGLYFVFARVAGRSTSVPLRIRK